MRRVTGGPGEMMPASNIDLLGLGYQLTMYACWCQSSGKTGSEVVEASSTACFCDRPKQTYFHSRGTGRRYRNHPGCPSSSLLRIEHGIAKFFELKIDKLDTERASGPRAQNGGCDVHHVGHGHVSISAAVA